MGTHAESLPTLPWFPRYLKTNSTHANVEDVLRVFMILKKPKPFNLTEPHSDNLIGTVSKKQARSRSGQRHNSQGTCVLWPASEYNQHGKAKESSV